MLIHVDGQADSVPQPGATLGAVVSDLRRSATSRRQVISAITLDGELLTPEREEVYSVRPAAEFCRLEARISDPEELIRDTFGGLARLLPALESRAVESARELRGGSPPGGTLMELAEALDFVLGAYGDGAGLLGGAPPAHGALETMEGVLGEVLSAIDANDTVRLCDALEYEFGPALRVLGEEIAGFLAAPLAEGGPAPGGEARA
jgi:hypothetical protein